MEDMIAMEAKLDALAKRLQDAQKERASTEARMTRCNRQRLMIVNNNDIEKYLFIGTLPPWRPLRWRMTYRLHNLTSWWRIQRAPWSHTSPQSIETFRFLRSFIFRSKAEEAELMADHNLNLFRRKQQELEELEEKIRCDEQVLKTKTNK